MTPPSRPNEGLDKIKTNGSLDGNGAGDHDQPYRFGSRPRTTVTYPFSTREYARLLVLRGRVQDVLHGVPTVDTNAAA